MIYFFFPETARLTLEEIAKNFGEEVAVHVTDATDEEKAQLDRNIIGGRSEASNGSETAVEKGEEQGDQTASELPAESK